MGRSSPEEVNNGTAKEGHEILPVPSEASEFLRLIARILRRRTGDKESAEDQSPEAISGVDPTERPDIKDKSEEGQG